MKIPSKLDIKIAPNFKLYEYCYSNTAKEWVYPEPIQFWLVQKHAFHIMQPIRDAWGEIRINSGIRTRTIIAALKRAGNAVSEHTDHSFLDPHVNRWGTGAADFYPAEAKIADVWSWIVQRVRSGKLDVGQAIFYPARNVIHISNPHSLLYSQGFSESLNRWGLAHHDQKLLISRDPGVYEAVESP